jgi:hypothetical protein
MNKDVFQQISVRAQSNTLQEDRQTDERSLKCKVPAPGREDAGLPVQVFGAGHSSKRPVVNVFE